MQIKRMEIIPEKIDMKVFEQLLQDDWPDDEEERESMEQILKGLQDNLLRGWGLNQFNSKEGLTLLVCSLIYGRAALKSETTLENQLEVMKRDVRDFCKQCCDPAGLNAE